jgi:hypothetical protein
MIKWRDLLDSDFASARSMHGRADDSVRAFTDDIENLVLGAYHVAQCWKIAENGSNVAPTLKRTFRGAGAFAGSCG